MPLHRFEFRAMGGPNSLQVHAQTLAEAQAAATLAIDEVRRIEAKYSRYRDDSVVSRINAAAGGAPVTIDAETAGLLGFAHAAWTQSGGLFDATSGVLRRAWDFDAPKVPSAAELAPILARVGWDALERDGDRVRLARAGMELDFGGFGKEYAADRAARVLREAGIESALVELGGDLVALAPQPGAEPWRVGIRHPRRDDALVATLELASGAMATSGDYERFAIVDGVRHHHILDPRTGRSARGFSSVTVHGANAMVAGSATTIAMLKGEREGISWLRELGLRYLAVTEDGRVLEGP